EKGPSTNGTRHAAERPPKIIAMDAGDDDEDGPRDPIGDLHPRAFQGILGELALAVAEETEANLAFVLAQLLAMFGACVGRGPHFIMSGTRHYMNLFFLLIGLSGSSRKGTSADVSRAIFGKVDEPFVNDNVIDGLNSGAGLLYQLRDAADRP